MHLKRIMHVKRNAGVVAFALLAAVGLSACGSPVNAGADNYVCVYDKADKLVKQLPPGSDQVRLGPEEKAVYLPASDRFYAVTTDDAIRDTLAPKVYNRAFAQGNVKMNIEGKIRFKFNLPKACEWYAKHGRRNLGGAESLGFNARGQGEQSQAGWFRFLAENFGEVMNRTTTEVVPSYTWPELSFNYPSNADENGVVPADAKPDVPARDKLGMTLGERFTKNLNASLGGDYFCGVVGEGDCPSITFEVTNASPENGELVNQRQALENSKQAINTAEQQNKLQRTNQAAQLEAEANKQKLLEAQLKTAELQARVDTAKCRQLGSVGLDCDGKRPSVIVGANPNG